MKNQAGLFSNIANLANMFDPHSAAQKDESRILHKMARHKGQIIEHILLVLGCSQEHYSCQQGED